MVLRDSPLLSGMERVLIPLFPKWLILPEPRNRSWVILVRSCTALLTRRRRRERRRWMLSLKWKRMTVMSCFLFVCIRNDYERLRKTNKWILEEDSCTNHGDRREKGTNSKPAFRLKPRSRHFSSHLDILFVSFEVEDYVKTCD